MSMAWSLLFLAFAACASAQLEYPVEDPSCISLSLSYPWWKVSGFEREPGTDATSSASFRLKNVANGQELTCSNKVCGDEGAKGIGKTSYNFDSATNVLSVSQEWLCTDEGPPHPEFFKNGTPLFAANGNVTLSLKCGENGACSQQGKDITIRGSLTSPVRITPVPAASPPGHDFPGCIASSSAPSWDVRDIHFRWTHTQPLDLGEFNRGYLDFTLTNHANNYSLNCQGSAADYGFQPFSKYLSGSAFYWYDCNPSIPGSPKYTIDTSFWYNSTTFELSINQTWYCDDEGTDSPVTISGLGSTILKPTCWEQEDPKETRCNFTASAIEGSVTNRTQMRPEELYTPVPAGKSCTTTSFTRQSWLLESLSYLHYIDQNGGGGAPSVNIMFLNEAYLPGRTPGFEICYGLGSMSPKLNFNSSEYDTSLWWPCDTFQRYSPEVIGIDFQLEVPKQRFAMNETWICSDKDPVNPIAFSAGFDTTIDLTCSQHTGMLNLFGSLVPASWEEYVCSGTSRETIQASEFAYRMYKDMDIEDLYTWHNDSLRGFKVAEGHGVGGKFEG